MMGIGLIIPIVLIVLLAYALGWLPQKSSGRAQDNSEPSDALQILRQRYARGEIGREEFERVRQDLIE